MSPAGYARHYDSSLYRRVYPASFSLFCRLYVARNSTFCATFNIGLCQRRASSYLGLIPLKAANQEEFDRSVLHAIQEASPDGILVVDAKGAMVSYNQRFIDIWGLRAAIEAEYPDASDYLPEPRLIVKALEKLKDPEAFLARVDELYANPRERDHTEIELVDGRVLERHSTGLFGAGDEYLGRVWFFRDITSRKQVEDALRESASFDMLTGQMNRRFFLESAAAEFERARRFEQPLAVAMIDLDFFKNINDGYGHAAGDYVLQVVCKRWRETLRSVDLLGRIGGEEFAMALPQIDPEGMQSVADRLSRVVSLRPIEFEHHLLDVSISGGVVWVAGQDQSIEDTLRRADEMLYRAKELGRNRVLVDEFSSE